MPTQPPASPPVDPASTDADAIVAALARIRGRRGAGRRGVGGFGGPGGPHGTAPHASAAPWRDGLPGDDHAPGDHGHPWEHRGPQGRGPRDSAGFGDPATHGARGRFGGPALLRLLGQLAHAPAPLSVSELAERIGVDQPRASRLVQQAVERDFAVREADPEDARRTRVRLTDAGERAVHGFRGQQRADAAAALEGFAATERTELARLLTKLADAWPEH